MHGEDNTHYRVSRLQTSDLGVWIVLMLQAAAWRHACV
jgi:hypothetical protein